MLLTLLFAVCIPRALFIDLQFQCFFILRATCSTLVMGLSLRNCYLKTQPPTKFGSLAKTFLLAPSLTDLAYCLLVKKQNNSSDFTFCIFTEKLSSRSVGHLIKVVKVLNRLKKVQVFLLGKSPMHQRLPNRWISTHAFRASLTKFSPTKCVVQFPFQ